MFLILDGTEVVGFWGNSAGDVFIESTVANLGLNPYNVKLIYFPKLKNPPENYIINGDNLKVMKKIEYDGEIIDELDYELEGTVFYAGGIKVFPC